MLKISSFIMSVITLLGLMLPGVKYGFKPTVEVDCLSQRQPIKNYATGFLYGLATEGVPSSKMAESINISSESQKTYGGLQHPIGDVNDVAKNLKNCDYIVVYLQDCFDTWYYCHEEIEELRKNGKYDCEKFVDERFLPQVREQVENISKTDYADRVVYCLYNECDNAIWFGAEDDEGNLQFNDEGRQNFYSAWEKTYKLVKEINPNAMIGGPGYYEYNIEKLTDFLDYCKDNKCIPDVMIYHELQDASSAFFEDHYEEYREIEREKYNMQLPIIVTEYGCMYECGNPGEMLPYICAMEKTGVYGNVAFWRLSNNLCDTCADANTPNANWWLYRWYADMANWCYTKTNIIDIMHSDVANVVKYRRDRFHYVPLNAISAVNYDNDEISVILGGCNYESNVVIKNLKGTKLKGENVEITVEAVYYKGLSGEVFEPVTISKQTQKAGNKLKLKVDCTDSSSIYKITIKKAVELSSQDYKSDNIPVRYEFEDGTRLGDCYVYDSAYATTGAIEGMVGGIENEGDGVSIKFNVPDNGKYKLDIIYGKANDGLTPADRVSAKALFSLDGKEERLKLFNTVRSEFTSCITLEKELSAGEHEICFKHLEGTYVLDSMLVSKLEKEEISALPDANRSTDELSAFLTIAPEDGFYNIELNPGTEYFVDGAKGKSKSDGIATVFLCRGLNYIEVKDKALVDLKVTCNKNENKSITFKPEDMALSDGAEIKKTGNTKTVSNISSDGGAAELTVNAEKAGVYRMTVTYSNNREGGVHDYNVDLIECYITAQINDEQQSLWCRNTMSAECFKTATVNVELKKGENKIIIKNNGESKFNDMTAFAPDISQIMFSPACS